jgi:oligopeptide/dipeptide ABC transporter ATP-binding protein
MTVSGDLPAASGASAPAPGSAALPLLEIADLTVRFPTARGEVRAVDGVSIVLEPGETLGIVGESGSGKSVLVRAALGLLNETAIVRGRSRFAGRDLVASTPKQLRSVWGRQVAMIFQNPMTSLNPVRRIGDQLTAPLHAHLGLSKKQARARAIELLDQVRIPGAAEQMDRYPHELSGGMRQRVMIAGALACRPKLLIADEPTTALDVTVQRQILDLMDVLQRELGTTMVLITHDLAVVAGRTDRIAVMYAGRVVEQATTRDLFDDPHHPYTAALLASVPQIERPSHERLQAIPGRPPDLVAPMAGCAFAPRCTFAQDRCRKDAPALETSAGHAVRCWFPLDADARLAAASATASDGG